MARHRQHADRKYATPNGRGCAQPVKNCPKPHLYTYSMHLCYCSRGHSHLAGGVPRDTSHIVLSPLLHNRGRLLPSMLKDHQWSLQILTGPRSDPHKPLEWTNTVETQRCTFNRDCLLSAQPGPYLPPVAVMCRCSVL